MKKIILATTALVAVAAPLAAVAFSTGSASAATASRRTTGCREPRRVPRDPSRHDPDASAPSDRRHRSAL